MKPLSETTVCVVDRGLFTHIALCLAEQCRGVYYVGPQERFMPRFEDACVGDGFGNIRRKDSVWDCLDADVFVFPDIGFAAEQRYLRGQGYLAVWGHHGADELEYDKGIFLRELERLGMDVPPFEKVQGMTALIDHLLPLEDVYVKLSRYRGDWETFHWRNADLDGDYLCGHPYNRCPAKELFTFYVFDPIDTHIEDGIDTWCIDGQWPKTVLHAMERKDKSLLGGMHKMSEIDESVRGVNEKFGPLLAEYGYRGAFSTEVRPPYFIDPTCRFGSPPSQLQTALIRNLPEVICRGAEGELVEPEYEEPLGAQVLITSDRCKDEWLTLAFAEELKPFVKSSFCCEINGLIRIAPNPLENWAGWLVATGNSIAQVVDRLKERKALLPEGFDCDITSLSDLLREMDEAKEQGIQPATKEIPEPEIVLEGKS